MGQMLTGLAALDERSREIFRQLVDRYLETGEPVGSRTISRGLSVNLSPASVRNIMADLEDTGLIASPHTSAGRIPTELGLRFFVDAIMERGSLSREQRKDIDTHISQLDREQRVEDVLTEATNVLSGLSQCAGLVVTPKVNMRLRHIEFVSLSPGKALVVLVGEDSTVENRAIDVPPGLPASVMSKVSNFLNS
ncbi:MAG: HrcA family transcriptional regulator, partial [Aestuariivirgaceae bacterium]